MLRKLQSALIRLLHSFQRFANKEVVSCVEDSKRYSGSNRLELQMGHRLH